MIRLSVQVTGADIPGLLRLQAALASHKPPALLGSKGFLWQAQFPATRLSVATTYTAMQLHMDYSATMGPSIFGGYRSEEYLYWQQVYDPAHTLGPLRLASNRWAGSGGCSFVSALLGGVWSAMDSGLPGLHCTAAGL